MQANRCVRLTLTLTNDSVLTSRYPTITAHVKDKSIRLYDAVFEARAGLFRAWLPYVFRKAGRLYNSYKRHVEKKRVHWPEGEWLPCYSAVTLSSDILHYDVPIFSWVVLSPRVTIFLYLFVWNVHMYICICAIYFLSSSCQMAFAIRTT